MSGFLYGSMERVATERQTVRAGIKALPVFLATIVALLLPTHLLASREGKVGLQGATASTVSPNRTPVPADPYDALRATTPSDESGLSVDLFSGTISLSSTDLALNGTLAPLSVVRTRVKPSGTSHAEFVGAELADWSVNFPRIETLVELGRRTNGVTEKGEWITATDAPTVPGANFQRCTRMADGVGIRYQVLDPPAGFANQFEKDFGWDGYSVTGLNGVRQPLLARDSRYNQLPSGLAVGGRTLSDFPGVTAANWVFACLPSTSNGEPGEGFLGISPDGLRYYFDHLVYLEAEEHSTRSVCFPRDAHDNPIQTCYGPAFPRKRAVLYASRVEDRFGNSFRYIFDGSKPIRVEANDGRRINISWRSDSRFIDSISIGEGAGAKAWRYAYRFGDGINAPRALLTSVTLPDGTSWTYEVARLFDTNDEKLDAYPGVGVDPSTDVTGFVLNPQGLRTDLRMRGIFFSQDLCRNVDYQVAGADIEYRASFRLIERAESGAGVSRRWSYGYQAPRTGAPTAPPKCSAVSESAPTFAVTETSPDNSATVYEFVNQRQSQYFGLLSRVRQTGRTETISYRSRSSGAYPERIGVDVKSNRAARSSVSPPQPFYQPSAELFGSFPVSAAHFVPAQRRTVVMDGVTFRKEHSGFDFYAKPTAVTSSSTLGYSMTTATEYLHSRSNWVIGQPSRETVSGIEVSRSEFDSLARPWRTWQFGQVASRSGYNADGTLAWVADAKNQTTFLNSWYRGVPRSMSYPDGTTRSATVSPEGWITSVTDQNGFTTTYTLDVMGRQTRIDYPWGPGENYTASTLSWKQLTANDWRPTGVSTGEWQWAEVRGNLIRAIYYDALLRPTATVEWDNANGSATIRSTRTSYDAAGRVAFQSYPVAGSEPTSVGTRTQYDTLGRVTSVSQDSEHGALTTTTEYLSGFQTRVTDPKEGQTTTRYLVYGEPSTKFPISITQPGDVITEITRDVFGKPIQLRRRNASGSLQVDRRYVYDAQQRLCKQIDPETQATVFDYDANGNMIWSATGQALPGTSACDRGSVSNADRIARAYDAMNRVTLVDFPDASVDISTAYTPDGLVEMLSAGPHVWKYTYNRLRLPTVERLEHTFQGVVYPYPTQWTYDALGHRSSMIAGNGIAVNYAPNALGQPTQAGSYATGALYHPDGSLKSFRYGNSTVRTVEKNARLLPSRIADVRFGTTIVDDRYVYDRNGNLTNQDDVLNLAGGDRTLIYDARDRLVSAQISGTQTEAFTYDALDNITSRQFGSQVSTYSYDTQRRLSSISGQGGTQSFGYDVRGNMTSRANVVHTYDRANRLTSVAGRGNYEYDGHGRRTVSWRADGTGKTDLYSLDGVLRLTGDNRRRGNTVYVHLGTQLVAEHFRGWDGSNETVEYVHGDLLGSSVARTSGAGAITERERSLSYGQALDGSKREAPGFTGHMEDPSLGLVYMQQRYYDPNVGRFISIDPVGPLSNPINHFGRYHYANNNPYRFTDPNGEKPIEEWISNMFGANREDLGYAQMRDHVRSGIYELNNAVEARYSQVRAVGAVGVAAYNMVDIRVEVAAGGGAVLGGSFSVLHGDGDVSMGVGEGAIAGIYLQPRYSLSMPLAEGLKNPDIVQGLSADGAKGRLGLVVSAGADVTFEKGGSIGVTPKAGVGIGQMVQGPAIKMIDWKGWNPKQGGGR